MSRRNLTGAVAALAALVLLAVAATGCGSGSSSASAASGGGSIDLVAYSTPEVAYDKLIPDFQKTAAGQGVKFTQSYGGSGDQSRAVDAGQPASVVHFALEPDIQRLVDDGLVASNWDQNAYHGVVTDSVVVFVVRKGNPKNIHTWDDLIKPGIQVITPNPFSSGGARWNIMAAYGAELHEGKTPDQAKAYLSALFHHVPVQDDKASAALQTFTNGKGDVLLSYENEALLAEKSGAAVEHVIPNSTILIQTPVAATKKGGSLAQAFVKYLYTPQAQTIFAQTGYRPVVPSVAQTFAKEFPKPSDLFTIDSLGGWDKVSTEFFDPDTGVMGRIEQGLGVPTTK